MAAERGGPTDLPRRSREADTVVHCIRSEYGSVAWCYANATLPLSIKRPEKPLYAFNIFLWAPNPTTVSVGFFPAVDPSAPQRRLLNPQLDPIAGTASPEKLGAGHWRLTSCRQTQNSIELEARTSFSTSPGCTAIGMLIPGPASPGSSESCNNARDTHHTSGV